ncbi:MAG: choloylglycine hydrolase [Lachnospiraceae bacterium]|nr:choloylglycine hydrolase [Lachnospiraceae bacterium]
MCTALAYKTKDFYFGRNLDLEFCYQETVTITPRNFPLSFRESGALSNHHAMIGMAYVVENYPLYYDAVNEKGLGMAGLNFPGKAVYLPKVEGRDNVSPFEFIPWILGQCADLEEARTLLERIHLADIPFSEELPLSPLHWIIADKNDSIVVEQTKDGLKIWDNPVGIMTNNPPFDMQMFNLNNYMGLTAQPPQNRFCKKLRLTAYSRGMGAMGLPGDLSSESRFVKAAFTKLNSVSGDSESESISQFFHILGSVVQQRGCVQLGKGKYEITIYSSCCNGDKGIYYYTTYENNQITAVDMHRENLEGSRLILYPLIQGQQIKWQN